LARVTVYIVLILTLTLTLTLTPIPTLNQTLTLTPTLNQTLTLTYTRGWPAPPEFFAKLIHIKQFVVVTVTYSVSNSMIGNRCC
jgi:hypothetical protein